MITFPFTQETTSSLMSTIISTQEFSDSEETMISNIAAGIAAVSLIGSLFIIVSYITFPELRSFAFELILMVAISDSLRSSSYVLSQTINSNLCYPQAVLMTFGEVASILWVGSIAYTIHRIFLWDERLSIENTHLVRYHIFCWGMAIILTILPSTTHDYESKDAFWCWIKFNTDTGVIWALVCYYIPVWLILCYLMFVYHKVWMRLKSEGVVRENTGRPKHQLVTQTRMAVYPTVFFATIIFACIDRMYELVGGRRNFHLALFHAITINMQGLINAFVYGFTTAVRMKWFACLCPQLIVDDANGGYISLKDEEAAESLRRVKGATDATDSTYSRLTECSDDQACSYSAQNRGTLTYKN